MNIEVDMISFEMVSWVKSLLLFRHDIHQDFSSVCVPGYLVWRSIKAERCQS